MAPNTGLAIGSSIAKGLDDAVGDYAKMRLQNAQMRSHQAQAQAMQTWRTSQAETMRQKTLGVDASKLDYTMALHRAGILPEQVVTAQMKGQLKDLLTNARPQDANMIQGWIQSRAAANQPLQPDSLNMNEAKAYTQAIGDEGRTTRTGMSVQGRHDDTETRADAQVTSSENYAGSRKYVADQARAGKSNTNAPANIMMRGLQTHINKSWEDYNNADKASGMSGPPDPDAVAEKRKMIMSEINAATGQLQSLHQGKNPLDQSAGTAAPAQQSGGSQGAFYPTPSGAPVAQRQAPPPAGRNLPASQWQQAQPGDIVTHDNGQQYKAVGNGQFAPVSAPPQAAPPAAGDQ